MRRTLQLIMLLAVGARIGAALYQGNSVAPLPGVFDQISYHKLAVRVLEGHGFSFETGWWPATAADQPTAHWSFLYTLFLSAIYFIFGVNPLAARIVQSIVMGVLQPLLAWRIGRRFFGPKVGLMSAALTAVYGYFVYYAGALLTESFYFLAVLWIVDISAALTTPPNEQSGGALRLWACLGFAFAAAALLRQVILLLVPVVFAWILWHNFRHASFRNRPPWKLRWLLLHRLVLALAILSACILPWTIRNYRVFGQFVLLNTNAGFAFFWGNHPIHGTRFIPILPGDGTRYGTLVPDELRGLNEAQLDRALLQRGIAAIFENPTRYALLSMSRVREYFKFWPSQDSGALSNVVRVMSFGLYLPFLLSGVWIVFLGRWRTGDIRQYDRPAAAFILLVSGVYCLIHLLTWTLIRYRLPSDAILMPFVAVSMLSAYNWALRSTQIAVPRIHRLIHRSHPTGVMTK